MTSPRPTGPKSWPSIRAYDGPHRARVAMPVGGIGTGTVSLGGRGDLRDWEIINRPAKGFAPRPAFLALRTRDASGSIAVRALEGPLDDHLFEGPLGATAPTHGLPRFREATFNAAYPFGRVDLQDADIPLRVSLGAWNPLVPGAVEDSSLPLVALQIGLTNPGSTPVEASVAFVLRNFIGTNGETGTPNRNVNEFRSGTTADGRTLTGVLLRTDGLADTDECWGTVAISTPMPDVTTRLAWTSAGWGGALLEFWDTFTATGHVTPVDANPSDHAPIATIVVATTVPAGTTITVPLTLSWHFPNRLSWTPEGIAVGLGGGANAFGLPVIGNEYTSHFSDAWDVAMQAAPCLDALENRSLAFVRIVTTSDLPSEVQEASLFNISTLRSQTCFRTPDGNFWGWEGTFDHTGSCYGSCTHVWNYEQTVPFLFGQLARTARRLEFIEGTRDDGHMAFRIALPLDLPAARERNASYPAAADGQMGCILKAYREWQLSGDATLLHDLWPRVRASLAYAWIPGGWDADRDGVMEGTQHNTMDVEYFGPNIQMGAWYLGALRAASHMARAVGEPDFATECTRLEESGRAWMDANLWNGEYYDHEIRPPATWDAVAPGLRHPSMGARDPNSPEWQLGAGCLVDQLIGQVLAHVNGLGHLLDPGHIRTTLHSIARHNRRSGFHDHFNPMRSYVGGDETALLMASYPRGERPALPFPYYAEVMTGFEYTAAVGMLYEGRADASLRDEGLRVIRDIRARYDGKRRNPFDEAECGHHYARAMLAWGAILALTGFHWSGVTGVFTIGTMDSDTDTVNWPWSNGDSWGTVSQRRTASGAITVSIAVVHGTLAVTTVRIDGWGSNTPAHPGPVHAGTTIHVDIAP